MKNVEWGEYKASELFTLQKITKMLSKEDLSDKFSFPAYSSESINNGIIGYADKPEFICNDEHPIFVTFGDHTRTFNIVCNSFSVLDNVKVLLPCTNSYRVLLWIITAWKKQIPNMGYARHWKIAKQSIISLPIKNNKIDFDFMESFIAELEAERIAELEAERIAELSAYLKVSGLDNYELSDEEQQAIDNYSSLMWEKFNVKELFGKSTRGKRLKSSDRITGNIPFVTAGETDEGISAFIGNDVEVFPKNTITIDMFGSAKYRNYDYGADDHIAVVHTENLSKYASIFVTTACHKAAHTGEFNYGHNFYAKDADKLMIFLPIKEDKPDFEFMETLISAIQKFVIKDVVIYTNKNIEATKTVVSEKL